MMGNINNVLRNATPRTNSERVALFTDFIPKNPKRAYSYIMPSQSAVVQLVGFFIILFIFILLL
jgi:hypothetical protein